MKMFPTAQFTDKLQSFVWEKKKSIRNLLEMLIKLWIVSTRKMLNKPTYCLIEKVCTALVERFGAVDGL